MILGFHTDIEFRETTRKGFIGLAFNYRRGPAIVNSLAPNLIIPIALVVLLLTGCNHVESPENELSAMTQEVSQEFEDVSHISTSDLAIWLAAPNREAPILLDVREPLEYAVSHLPGAIRVAPDSTAEQIIAMIDPSRPIVLYCSVGYRSSVLARRLVSQGAKQTKNLEGSIFKWANEGRPLVRDSGFTRLVHPYDDSYGRMLLEEYRSYR
ncbi:MAG: rhodanese-related sulfurtransferase [Halioglobus sp.]|jgi:rhodanese-related sulfurtransferase